MNCRLPEPQLRLEIQLDRVDQRHQPLNQRHVSRMSGIGVGRRLVGEPHNPAKVYPWPSRREIRAHMHVDQSDDVAAKSKDLLEAMALSAPVACGFQRNPKM